MKKFFATLLLLSSISCFGQQDLQWCANAYTSGNLNQTYTSIGLPATNVTFSYGGSTGQFTSNYPQKVGTGTCTSGGFGNPDRQRLSIRPNYSTNSQCISTTITFAAGVSNLSFNLYEIDGGLNNAGTLATYKDQVTVVGSFNGGSVNPTITANMYSSVSGNILTAGTIQDPNSTDPIPVVFSGYVSSVTLTYCNGSGVQADPITQAYHIGGLTWDDPLPVTLTSFTTQSASKAILLNWETSSEINSDRFDVQKSRDAKSFENIGQLTAAFETTDTQKYQFKDATPFEGWNYYRLKAIDRDGSFAFSRIITAFYEQNETYFDIEKTLNDGSILTKTNLKEPIFEVYDLLGRRILNSIIPTEYNYYQLFIQQNSGTGIVKAVGSNGEVFTKKIWLF